MGIRARALLLAGSTALVVLYAALGAPRGAFTIDEGIYHLMVENLASGNGWFVWNGYEEFPSPELTLRFLRPHEGRLAAQYPFLYAPVALPLYLAFGLGGLFLLNALGFAAAVVLTVVLARQLFGDTRLALDAALLLVAATYLAEYAPAIWPHLSATALVVGAFVLAVDGARRPERGAWSSAAAGFLMGNAVGLRLGATLLLMGVAVPLLLVGSGRLRRSAAFLAGLAVPLLVLAVANGARFGVWSPFSYATEAPAARVVTYLPLASAGLASALAVWALTRPSVRDAVRRHRPASMVLGTAGVVGLALVPAIRGAVAELVHGMWVLVVDLRAYTGPMPEPGPERGPGGGLAYYGVFKKALLQSCPYLVILAVPVWDWLRAREWRWEVTALVAAVVPVIAVFGSRQWHGGLGFNMRYMLPVLPFAAILTALALQELVRGLSGGERRGVLGVGVAAGLATCILMPVLVTGTVPLAVREHLLLTTPLVLAGLLLASLGVWRLRGPRSAGPRLASALLVAVAVGWSAGTAYGHDLLTSQVVRWHQDRVRRAGLAALGPDAILFTHIPYSFLGPLERRIRLADPTIDEFDDFLPLADHHLDAGHRVYVRRWDLEAFRAAGHRLPPGYTTSRVMEEGATTILELRREPSSASEPRLPLRP